MKFILYPNFYLGIEWIEGVFSLENKAAAVKRWHICAHGEPGNAWQPP